MHPRNSTFTEDYVTAAWMPPHALSVKMTHVCTGSGIALKRPVCKALQGLFDQPSIRTYAGWGAAFRNAKLMSQVHITDCQS